MLHGIKLHGFFKSSCSHRVRIALHLKKLPYETVVVNLDKGDHLKPEYQKMNPSGLIPTLEINGLVLTESLPICEYLDEVYPERGVRLLPPMTDKHTLVDAKLRFRVRRLCEIINAST